jgi:putative tryptophan/tyrosine transport system substrate-binding protein
VIGRRQFIALLGGAAAWPLAAHAQQPAMPVIGFLYPTSADAETDRLRAFRQGLKDTGYVEGENVAIDYRFAHNQLERLPMLAADLVRQRVAVIIASGGPPVVLAAKAATATIPIVFIIGDDPVELGLVTSLARPGGNITGVSILSGPLTAKRLELLRELVPQASVIACLVNPNSPEAESQLTDIRAAARTLGEEILVLNASSEDELDTAFATLVKHRAGGLFVGNDALFVLRREQLVTLSAQHAIPAVYFLREFAAVGGLMSYGNSLADAYRQVGIYIGRILRGTKPADLPVQQAVKIELVINLATAKALGLEVPPTLLARADEVIE